MTRSKGHSAVLAGTLLVVAVGLAWPAVVLADSDDGWRLRFYAASIDFDSSQSRPRYDLDFGFGLGVNAEYRFSPRLGVDLGVLGGAGVDVAWHELDIEGATVATYDTLTFTPLTAGLNVHLTPRSRVDVYLGPVVGLVQYGSLQVRSGSEGVTTGVRFDEDLAIGATVGLTVPFGQQHWSFNASVTALDSQLNGSSPNGVRLSENYDATIFGLGCGYRF